MKRLKLIVPLLLLFFNACASMDRAPSLNMLEKRADYTHQNEIKEALGEVDNPLLVPVRTNPTVADIWVHPHELPNGDYFRGGWIRTVVTRSHWQVEEEHQPLVIEPKPIKKEIKKLGGTRD